jgi:hypothetical protein
LPDFYYAKPGPITPIGLVGHKIAVWALPSWSAFKIIYVQGYPRSAGLMFNMGAVLAGNSSAPTQLLTLEMKAEPPELAQVRFYVIDDIQVEVRRAQSDVLFQTKNIVCRADLFTAQVDPCGHTTEFVVLKDDEPLVVAANPTGYNLVQSRMCFYGFKFILEDLKVSTPTQQAMEAKIGTCTFVAAGGL